MRYINISKFRTNMTQEIKDLPVMVFKKNPFTEVETPVFMVYAATDNKRFEAGTPFAKEAKDPEPLVPLDKECEVRYMDGAINCWDKAIGKFEVNGIPKFLCHIHAVKFNGIKIE